jgi:hypothetical protein
MDRFGKVVHPACCLPDPSPFGDVAMSEQATSSQVREHRARWKGFLALGVMLLVLGLGGISIATLLELTS